MSLITISTGDVAKYQGSGTPATLRLYANQQFTTSENVVIPKGSKQNPTFYQELACSLSGETIQIASGTVYSTTDSNQPRASYTVVVYDSDGVELVTLYTNFRVSNTNATTTWSVLETYSRGYVRPYATDTLSSDEILDLFNDNQSLVNKASDVIYGATSLDTVPVSLADPEAVGSNSNRIEKNLSSDYGNSFATAITAIGATETTLIVKNAVTVSANTSLPANITLEVKNGGLITVATGQTLTILGAINAGQQHIFSLAGTGTVNISTATIEYVYPEWWGAKGDGSTDNTVALGQMFEALTLLSAFQRRGRTVMLNGDYNFASVLDWAGLAHVTFIGNASSANHSGEPSLRFTGSGSTQVFNMEDWAGVRWENIRFEVPASGFTGDMFKQTFGTSDPNNLAWINCSFSEGANGNTVISNSLLNLNGVIDSVVRDCFFTGSKNGIIGEETIASNHITIDTCQFRNQSLAGIYSPGGTGWVIINPAFHGSNTGTAVGLLHHPTRYSYGLKILSGYTEAVLSGTGTWVSVRGVGISISGMYIATPNAGGACIAIVDDSSAIEISAVTLNGSAAVTGIKGVSASAAAGISVRACNFTSTVPVSGLTAANYSIIDSVGSPNRIGGGLNVQGLSVRSDNAGIDAGYLNAIPTLANTSASLGVFDGGSGIPSRAFLFIPPTMTAQECAVAWATGAAGAVAVRALLDSASFRATVPIGYATGVGGTQTQGSSKATGVTLDKVCGQITTHNAALNDNTTVTFTVTNAFATALDELTVWHVSGGTLGGYLVWAHTPAAGSFKISIRNVSGGPLSEALVLGFTLRRMVIT